MYEITNFYHMGLGQFLEEIPVPDFGPCEEMLNPSKRMTRRFERRSFDYILIQMDVYINNLITDLTKAMKSEICYTKAGLVSFSSSKQLPQSSLGLHFLQ